MTELSAVRNRMLDRLAKSDVHFRSQQKGEPDLAVAEKREIAEEILSRNISLFLQRFHKVLSTEDIEYFEHNQNEDYEISFYVNEIRKYNDLKKSSIQIKNRRFEAMQQLIREGDYFKDCQMRNRNPFLYEQMIGKYLSETERKALEDEPESATFSGFLMRTIQKSQEEAFRKEQEATDKINNEAYIDSDQEEEEEEKEEDSESELEDEDVDDKKKNPINEDEREMLRQEFTNIMYQQFLSGKDEYDYRSVDENAEFDSIKLRQEDEEEKYFDCE